VVPSFTLTTIEQLQRATEAYVAALDAYHDDLIGRMQQAQACRRVAAEPFGIDRRAGVGTFGEAEDSSRRAEYEGEGQQDGKVGRIVPRAVKEIRA
jgi:hypothetical protein